MTVPHDTPEPQTEPDARRAARANLRHILVAWIFGAGWAALVSGAPFIRFGEQMGLKQRPFVWGLLAAMPFLATYTQVLGSWWVETRGHRKVFFVVALLVQRFAWLAIALLPWTVAPGSTAAVLCVLGLVALHATGGAVGTPAWTSWMADVIPRRVRGRYFGARLQLGMMTLIPLALLAGWLLSAARTGVLRYPWPAAWNDWSLVGVEFGWTQLQLCSVLFAVGAVLGVVDILMFLRVPDTWRPAEAGRSLRQILGGPLRDPAFRRFLLFYFCFTLSVPGIGYYVWLYVLNDVAVPEVWAQAGFMGCGGLGAIAMAGVWGRVIDRFGRHTAWRITYAVPVLLPLAYGALNPSIWPLLLLVAFLDGGFWNGAEQTNFNAILNFSGQPRGGASSSYQAVFALAMASAGTLSGLTFGGIARLSQDVHVSWAGWELSYVHVVFAVATAVRLASYLVLLPRLREPEGPPVGRAVQFLLSGAYQRAAGLLTFPWRLITTTAPRRPGDSVDDEPEPANERGA